MDSVDKAFEDLLALNLCLKRIHWFSSGIPGREMCKDGDRCTKLNYWSLITSRVVEKSTVSLKTLIQACRVGRVDAIQAIVSDYEVDVNSTDPYGWTALHFAVLHNQKEVVNCLQALGARDLTTNEGISPSDMRPELLDREPEPWQVPDTIEKLVDELETFQRLSRLSLPENSSILVGRLLRIIGKFGCEMILALSFIVVHDDGEREVFDFRSMGASLGSVWICRICLELDIDLNISNNYHITALNVACTMNYIECVRFLLDAGINTNKSKYLDYPALLTACMTGSTECARLLLEAGADVNIRDKFNRTALHLACQNGHTECIRLLLEAGADVNLREHDRTALDVARLEGNTECARLLEEHLRL